MGAAFGQLSGIFAVANEDLRAGMFWRSTSIFNSSSSVSRQNCLNRAFVSYWSRKFQWDAAGGSLTRESYRNSVTWNGRIEFWHQCYPLRSLWTRFLLPDMFVYVSQVLCHCLAGCIDLPAKLTTCLSVFIFSFHCNLKSLRVVDHSEPGFGFRFFQCFDCRIIVPRYSSAKIAAYTTSTNWPMGFVLDATGCSVLVVQTKLLHVFGHHG